MFADRQPEMGMVNGLDVVRVIVIGLDNLKVPLLITSAAGREEFNANAFTVTSNNEFLSVPLFTVRILKSVLRAVVPLICLSSDPVNTTLQIWLLPAYMSNIPLFTRLPSIESVFVADRVAATSNTAPEAMVILPFTITF